jgi:putative ABC transport system substrate-binding protein
MSPCPRRREFIAALGGAAALPPAARAQRAAFPVIGFLHSTAMVIPDYRILAFRRGLNDVGFAEGRNLAIGDHVFHPEMNYSQTQLDQLDRLTER